MIKNIAHIVVGLPVEGPFDYEVPEKDRSQISVGHRVLVSFGRRQIIGYVVGFAQKSDFENPKTLVKILDEEPIFDEQQLELSKTLAAHYGCSLGEAVETMLPFSVRKRKSLPLSGRQGQDILEPQAVGLSRVAHVLMGSAADPSVREEIFKQISQAQAQGRGVLCLAPDADCAKALYRWLDSVFPGEVLGFDGKPGKKQIEQWLSVWTGKVRLVVSARSGIFLPVMNLGLIVLTDEDHYGYIEDQTPFYHAREVARMRARQEGCSLVVSAGVPSAELWRYAQEENWEIHRPSVSSRARFVYVDLKNYKPQKSLHFSVPIFQAVIDAVSAQKKVLVVLNRRGFGTFMHCPHCEFVMRCSRCDVAFSYSEDEKVFVCPRCQSKEPVSTSCPSCKKTGLKFSGGGIERVASDLARLVPQARISVVDRTCKTIPKSVNICVGTQAVFQAAYAWRPDVAVVLDVDSELGRMDFRSSSKVFTQLAGLCALASGTVFVQTWNPDHRVFADIQKLDLDAFYEAELKERRDLSLPPFAHVISIVCRSADAKRASAQSEDIHARLLELQCQGLEIHEAQEDFRSKLRDQYRFIIILKSQKLFDDLPVIRKVLKSVKRKAGVTTTVQVDP